MMMVEDEEILKASILLFWQTNNENDIYKKKKN